MRPLRTLALLVVALSGRLSAQPATTPPPAPTRLAVKAARLVDTKAGTVVQNAVVLVEGDRVKEVGSGIAVPSGYQVIDLGSATLLPGLIDCHTHITSQPTDYYEDIFR